MLRYFFDIRDDSGLHRDVVGELFDSIEAARQQCQVLLPDIAREDLPDGDLHTVSCDVLDMKGRVIYRGELTFRGVWYPG